MQVKSQRVYQSRSEMRQQF